MKIDQIKNAIKIAKNKAAEKSKDLVDSRYPLATQIGGRKYEAEAVGVVYIEAYEEALHELVCQLSRVSEE